MSQIHSENHRFDIQSLFRHSGDEPVACHGSGSERYRWFLPHSSRLRSVRPSEICLLRPLPSSFPLFRPSLSRLTSDESAREVTTATNGSYAGIVSVPLRSYECNTHQQRRGYRASQETRRVAAIRYAMTNRWRNNLGSLLIHHFANRVLVPLHVAVIVRVDDQASKIGRFGRQLRGAHFPSPIPFHSNTCSYLLNETTVDRC